MIRQNLHMHSTWDDGKNTCEEMILASRAAGLTSVGVSLHSPMPGGVAWSPDVSVIPAYLAQLRALKEKYAGEITVYTGIEWDVASPVDLAPYDYVIGSVHQLPVPGHPDVDCSAEVTTRYISEHFGGDSDLAAMMFFGEYRKIAANPKVSIVAHFDVITKFDEQRGFFDENSPRYIRAAENAMERLTNAGKIFEVNTGAISRGYRTTPYPAMRWLNLLHEMGGRVTIGSDAHHTSGVTCAFDLAQQRVKDAGFTEIWNLDGKQFIPVEL